MHHSRAAVAAVTVNVCSLSLFRVQSSCFSVPFTRALMPIYLNGVKFAVGLGLRTADFDGMDPRIYPSELA